MTAPLFRTEDLWKHFGGVTGTREVTLAVQPGEFRAIIGPNGAGKSTFFNLVSGFLRPDAGAVFFNGREITGLPPYKLFRAGISRTFQITSVLADQTVRQNVEVALLSYHRKLFGMWRLATGQYAEECDRLLELIGLREESDKPAGLLSHGDQKRLELGVALANQPTLLLLDEPTAGMAANERLASIEMIHRITKQLGITVIFTEHDMQVVFSAADSISVLHQGRIIAEGAPEEIRANTRVQEVYLGQQADTLQSLEALLTAETT
jgi:branched-chain amino acid transport system ATP-binding protein